MHIQGGGIYVDHVLPFGVSAYSYNSDYTHVGGEGCYPTFALSHGA